MGKAKRVEKQVFWGVPWPRQVMSVYADTLISVAQHTPFPRIRLDYGPTDRQRNILCDRFLAETSGDYDALIMLDTDHKHPPDVVTRLAQHVGKGVIGGLAMVRDPSDPYPMVYQFDQNRDLMAGAHVPRGQVVRCDMISPCGVSIERWVLVKLKERGFYPWWRYLYDMWPRQSTEDYYFGRSCFECGIPHYCDTSIELPHHYDDAWLTLDDWIKTWEEETGEAYDG